MKGKVPLSVACSELLPRSECYWPGDPSPDPGEQESSFCGRGVDNGAALSGEIAQEALLCLSLSGSIVKGPVPSAFPDTASFAPS